MAVNLAPTIRQRFGDSNLNPLSGGKLYSYASGTSTPQNTYTDSTGSTPNANPVILDANGEANVWLDVALSYKFVLKNSADVTQWTVDNVIGLAANNSISTASIQDLAVTTAKLVDDSVTAAKLADDASIDANRAVTTNHIRDAAVTRNKLDVSTTQWPKQMDNVSLGASFAANAMTITALSNALASLSATDYSNIAFRSATLGTASYTVRKLLAAISMTIPSTATLGFTSAVSGRIHIAYIDNAGTLEIAVCGSQLFDDNALITTTAIGGGSNSRTTIYSTTARSNVACRYIGFMDLTQATAGTWVTAPSKIMVTGAVPYPKRKILHLTTGNGHGSSGTFVRRLTTTVENSGADVWTYADSGTAGMSVTILEEGWYKGSASDLRSTNTPEVVITKNASNLAVGPATLTNGTILGTAMAPTNTWAQASWEDYLYAGDVIRMQSGSGANDDTTIRTIFRMMKTG